MIATLAAEVFPLPSPAEAASKLLRLSRPVPLHSPFSRIPVLHTKHLTTPPRNIEDTMIADTSFTHPLLADGNYPRQQKWTAGQGCISFNLFQTSLLLLMFFRHCLELFKSMPFRRWALTEMTPTRPPLRVTPRSGIHIEISCGLQETTVFWSHF